MPELKLSFATSDFRQPLIELHCPERAGAFRSVLESLAQAAGFAWSIPGAVASSPPLAVVHVAPEAPGAIAERELDRPVAIIHAAASLPERRPVQFSGELASLRVFHARTVPGVAVPVIDREFAFGDAIANVDTKPVWVSRRVNGHRHEEFLCRINEFQPGDSVFHHLNGQTFLDLLPLVDWLRDVLGLNQWQPPPLRAAFIFDDPNLRLPHYGFLSFARFAARGRERRFHTTMATIPLDAGAVGTRAAGIFREHPDTLSLLVHGNNHLHRELARPYSENECLGLARQALQRIRRLEEKAGVAVSRLMAPPHGACSERMLRALARAGFEGATISHGSLFAANPGSDWRTAIGLRMSEVVGGLPVLPRFGLTAECFNAALLAAYLHQPILPLAHHWDLVDGPDLLEAAAGFINGLGHVEWTNTQSIARANFRMRQSGCRLDLELWSRHVEITVPPEVSEIHVIAAWADEQDETLACRPLPAIAPIGGIDANHRSASRYEVMIQPRTNLSPENPRPPGGFLTAKARRVLTECRDRMQPLLPRRR